MRLLPVGMDDFSKIIDENLYFVDKTLFIQEILDDRNTEVVVLTRPRRFGKTTNLLMLYYFLSAQVDNRPTAGLFEGLKIAQCAGDYMQHQGQYPVIFITMKEVRALDYATAMVKFAEILANLYSEHREALLSSTKLTDRQKENFKKIEAKEASHAEMQFALSNLTHYLYLHYDKKPWLLIDEYDTPIQSGYINGYYDPMVEFMRGMLGAALKTNRYLKRAVITGILRVAKESLFSGLNNVKVHSLLSNQYSEHFGFTESEVNAILAQFQLTEKMPEVKTWYNGYQIGETIVYNPWSIANYIDEQGLIQPYWVNTSDNSLIKKLVKDSPLAFKKDFEQLLLGKSIAKLIDAGLTFKYLNHNPSAVWNLFLMAGYLKPIEQQRTEQGVLVTMTIPNNEVRIVYRQIIEELLSDNHSIEWYNVFIDSLLNGQIDVFQKHLEEVLIQITSFYDFDKKPEVFYQGLMLGFTASLHSGGQYEIQSNRESGLGRFDVLLIPKDPKKLGIIMELKVAKEKESLESVAKEALAQIERMKYAEGLHARGIHQCIKIGVGFYGKELAVCSSEHGPA